MDLTAYIFLKLMTEKYGYLVLKGCFLWKPFRSVRLEESEKLLKSGEKQF